MGPRVVAFGSGVSGDGTTSSGVGVVESSFPTFDLHGMVRGQDNVLNTPLGDVSESSVDRDMGLSSDSGDCFEVLSCGDSSFIRQLVGSSWAVAFRSIRDKEIN